MSALQLGLFATGEVAVCAEARAERTDLGGGSWVELRRGWLAGADTLCQDLISCVPWRHHRRWMYERYVDEPRLSCWYARGSELPDGALEMAGDRLERLYTVPLAGPGLNYYRDGRDSVAFHADRELGTWPTRSWPSSLSGPRGPSWCAREEAGAPSTFGPHPEICWSWAGRARPSTSTPCPRRLRRDRE